MRKLAQVQLNTSVGFFVQPIGIIESCYKQCIGTPRQGQLVPSSRSIARLTPNMSPGIWITWNTPLIAFPSESLDGLEQFSHVWLTFQFHMNTNVLKEAKAFSGVQENNKRYTFTAKITPPVTSFPFLLTSSHLS
jgi:tRNA (Thr-GGU) A37 N-methylase